MIVIERHEENLPFPFFKEGKFIGYLPKFGRIDLQLPLWKRGSEGDFPNSKIANLK
jgi:hypothetical protein